MSRMVKCYHLSHIKNRDSNLKEGLIPKLKTDGRIRYGPRIFVSISLDDLAFDYVGNENVDCWSFEVEETELEKDVVSGVKSHFFVVNGVAANKITLEKNYPVTENHWFYYLYLRLIMRLVTKDDLQRWAPTFYAKGDFPLLISELTLLIESI